MKKKSLISIIAILLICSISLPFPAYAATNASAQISSYSMSATPVSGGQIAIEFSITGAYQMAVIGAKTISIYEYHSTYWSYVDGYTQYDDGMTRTNAFNYGNSIYFDGESGTEYRIYVQVFAEDSSGASDSRSETFYVTVN